MPRTPSRTSRVRVSNGAARSSDGEQVVHRPAVHDGHRHELLGEDVERVARDDGWSRSRPRACRARRPRISSRSPRYFGKMTPLLGAPTWWPARPIALEAAGDAGGALDLDHEVHGAHVDAELEAAVATSAGSRPGLQLLLDLQPLLAGDAAVVGADQLLAGELVEALGEPLGEAPAVGEDDRGVVAADELQDRAGGWPARCWSAGSRAVAGPPGCSSSGRTSPRRPCPRPGRRPGARAACGRRHRRWRRRGPGPTPPRNRAMASSGRCVARQADALQWAGRRGPSPGARQGLEALQAEARGGRRASCRRWRGPRRR